ncbi:transcriptional regulator, MarR family [Lachnospiraceae bacterium KM106-2]|nr:transcriptional regulator, MarR family [Lachnospiraceae bacterium KM106-2]
MKFHIALMRTHIVFHRKLYGRLVETKLTTGQPKVLDYLSEHDGSVQKDIATACQIEPATVTNLLYRMEEAGLIERKSKQGNRRSLYVYMTERGRAEQQKVTEAFRQLDEGVFEGFDEDEKKQFITMFERVYDNLSNM